MEAFPSENLEVNFLAREKKKATVNKTINLKQYKSKREMNIGILIFAVVFFYLVITIFTYATSKKISVYEVRQGSIVKDYSYTGLILREETLVNAEADGYISYYQNENSKVKAGSNVYAISTEKLQSPKDTEQVDVALNDETQKNLNIRVQNFNENFNPGKFSSVYSLKDEYVNALHSASNQTRNAQLDALIAESGIPTTAYQSIQDGIISMTYDGYEGLTEEKLRPSHFDRSSYEATHMEDQMSVSAGTPVYKLVTNEDWNVYVRLDKKTVRELRETSYVKVRIDKDSETVWAEFSILKKGRDYYGKLSFDNSMIRYCDDRFFNIELILEDQSGLKIPKSSVIEKEFYVVPQDYLTTSGSSMSSGVMVKDKDDVKYVPTDIYETSEDGYVYLNPKVLGSYTTLVKPESSETYELDKTANLKGVYNINQGYAVFKVVDILCENDDYYIVQQKTAYGLSDYDHIVQDGTTVREDEVVFQ